MAADGYRAGMVDLRELTDVLVMRPPLDALGTGESLRAALSDGVVHVDLGDPDRVFLVTVTEVPRRRLLAEPVVVADLDGVDVHLVGVEVDNVVTVRLEGRGPAARERLASYGRLRGAWDVEPVGAPPPWPAALLRSIDVVVTDDLGTPYRPHTAECGGEGREWLHVAHLRPYPPVAARTLRLSFRCSGGRTTTVELPLDGSGGRA